jgi:hypothetical protein
VAQCIAPSADIAAHIEGMRLRLPAFGAIRARLEKDLPLGRSRDTKQIAGAFPIRSNRRL